MGLHKVNLPVERNLTAKDVREGFVAYHELIKSLNNVRKMYAYHDVFNHSSGVDVKALVIIPVHFNLEEFQVRTDHFVVPSDTYDTLDGNWLVLSSKGSRVVMMSLEDFFALPDWTDEHAASLEAEIVVHKMRVYCPAFRLWGECSVDEYKAAGRELLFTKKIMVDFKTFTKEMPRTSLQTDKQVSETLFED